MCAFRKAISGSLKISFLAVTIPNQVKNFNKEQNNLFQETNKKKLEM